MAKKFSLTCILTVSAVCAYAQGVPGATYSASVNQEKYRQPEMHLSGPTAGEGILPLAIGLIPPAQFPAADWDVVGLRLNIFAGEHNNVSFVDVGVIANFVNSDLLGVQVAGLWNQVENDAAAVQIGGIGNSVGGSFVGLQVAGIINDNSGSFETKGAQVGCVNLAVSMSGIQVGLINHADILNGLQIGVINMTRVINGLQIGVLNFIETSNVPCMPIINFAF